MTPHARTVLLKANDAAGFTFYTNRTSRKGQDLAGDPRCCAIFPWYGIGRQVIIEGVALAAVSVGERAVLPAPGRGCRRSAPGRRASRGCLVPRGPRRPGRRDLRRALAGGGPRCRCPTSGAGYLIVFRRRSSSGSRVRTGCTTSTQVPAIRRWLGHQSGCRPEPAAVLRAKRVASRVREEVFSDSPMDLSTRRRCTLRTVFELEEEGIVPLRAPDRGAMLSQSWTDG